MNEIQKKDLRYGYQSESDIHEFLETYFGKLQNTKDNQDMGEFYEFDKYNENVFIEMKTRRIKHNQYNSLMFGKNKLNKAKKLKEENPLIRVFFLWRCLDGVYYWELDSSTYDIKFSGRTDRGKDERADLVHVATKDLTSLDIPFVF